ncbi:MAG: lysoplasmalogenase [Candidatus Hydrogenedentes bacterium]|nr:lysoplasmalogenase [Candidatus Hydrogenedentota bacterium]
MIYSTTFTTVALALFMGNNALGLGGGGYLKMATSTGFLAIALAAGGLDSLYGRMVLAALFFSWWGDLFLISGKEKVFLMGLIAFFIGHTGFAGAFLAHGVDWKWFGVGTALSIPPLIVVIGWLNPHLGDMRLPVYAYMVIITFMVACSIGAWGHGATTLIVAGAVLFYLSDIFVARDRFVTPSPWNRHLGLPLYYVAQMLLATSITHVNESQA